MDWHDVFLIPCIWFIIREVIDTIRQRRRDRALGLRLDKIESDLREQDGIG